ncbi:hypothetical protein GcM1_207020 [Golovinomyces cichoracearum]|uniref:Uncharacterized protein n=1 Tax=Golovinomyces cichoracearum TaxID=62708 RepID=A0A420IWE5_9PEZI|nr:hypothetical protein GcM1_207020 [Golovinomyces cichoracearum]
MEARSSNGKERNEYSRIVQNLGEIYGPQVKKEIQANEKDARKVLCSRANSVKMRNEKDKAILARAAAG